MARWGLESHRYADQRRRPLRAVAGGAQGRNHLLDAKKRGVQASAQAPLEARPIVLLAQLYRLWAAARAGDLVRWIDFHKLSPLEDAEGNQAAEELGLLAAGMLEEADATKRDGALLALGQSKAYDRVPLDLLAELLRDSGVHPAIGGPMLCMARSRRRIKVLDAIGESRQPTSGLVPGCPMVWQPAWRGS